MIPAMTDRGLPIVDGAPACPFVAFEDDRDGRALAPDHRHRCYAEARPAPRALAHQEAYCLSSAFPVCPTFQDWARREAAAARPAAPEGRALREEPPVSRPMPPRDREGYRTPGTETPPPTPPRRHQPRDWAAPPPWSEEEGGPEPDALAAPPPFLAGRAVPAEDAVWAAGSRGLAGSAADRLAGPDPDAPVAPPSAESYRPGRDATPRTPRDDDGGADDLDDEDAWSPAPPARPSVPPPGRRGAERAADRGAPAEPRGEQVRRQRDEDAAELFGPAWEQPRRYEAYPTLHTRMGLPSFSGLWLAVVVVVLAAVVLFFAGPMLLGLGGKSPETGAGANPSATAGPGGSPSPTLPPEPTSQMYVVAKGDTMSRIAKKFGLTIEQLMAANPQIKNPDRITIGDQVTIPVPVDSAVPDQVQGSTAP